MILDKIVNLEVARAAGFIEGLNAAAEYHDNLAENWYTCAQDTTNSIDAEQNRQKARFHKKYARDMHSLKERSTPDEQKDAKEERP